MVNSSKTNRTRFSWFINKIFLQNYNGYRVNTIFIYFVHILKKNKKKLFQNNVLIFILISLNLLIFLYIPAELSYLQPAIIFLYLFFLKEISQKLIMVLIVLNFLNWGINLDILKINYKDNSLCSLNKLCQQNLKLDY